MTPRFPTRRSDTSGHTFGILMLMIVCFLVVLMLYFKTHQNAQPLPQRPPGMFLHP